MTPKVSIGTSHEQKKTISKTLTLEDAENILANKDSLPFKLDKKIIDNI